MLNDQSHYDRLRGGARTLVWTARLVQLGFLGMGLAIFLDQSRDLLSDAQFTWAERNIMGMIALSALGGCGFAGWVAGRLIAVAADGFEAMADVAESAWRSAELMETQIVPALARIARALEQPGRERDREPEPERERNRERNRERERNEPARRRAVDPGP